MQKTPKTNASHQDLGQVVHDLALWLVPGLETHGLEEWSHVRLVNGVDICELPEHVSVSLLLGWQLQFRVQSLTCVWHRE